MSTDWNSRARTWNVPGEPAIPEQAVEAAALVMARKKYGHMSSLLSLPIAARNAMLQNAREILTAAQPLMGVQRPDREAVARVLWDESGQGGVTFETQQRRYEVADAILALLRTRADHCAACGEYMPPHARHMCANWPPASPPPLAESGWQERWLTGALAGLDERLDRLLLKADDNERFVLSKDSARNIVEIAREWLRNRLPAPPHIAEEEQTK